MKRGLYFIAILPPNHIAEKVQKIKKEFVDKFNSEEAYRRPAHFTLQPPFQIPEATEAELIDKLIRLGQTQNSFCIKLTDFNHFRDDVIYIDVEDPARIKALHADLIHFLQAECSFTDKMIRNKSLTPHMTVAYRDLDAEHFQRAWKLFKERSFSYSFQVKSIFLLKHDYKQWQVHHEFPFTES